MPAELATGLAIALAVTAISAPILATADGITKAVSGKSLWEHFVSYLNKDKNGKNTKEEIEKLVTISGAKNTSILGRPIPLTLGTHLLAPYYCGNPYIEISGTDGEDEYYKMSLCCGYDNINVDHIKMGNIEIATNRNADGTVKADGINTTSIPCDTQHPLSQSGDIEIELVKGNKQSTIYPQKVYDEPFNARLFHLKDKDGLEINRASAVCPQAIEVQIDFPALVAYNGKGDQKEAEVYVRCMWSLDEQNWNYMYFDGGQRIETDSDPIKEHTTLFKKKKSKEMRFIARQDFTYSELFNSNGDFKNDERVVYVRVVRTNTEFEAPEKVTEEAITSCEDKVYLTNIRTWCFDYIKTKDKQDFVPQELMDKARMSMTTRLAFKIKATETTKQYIDSINLLTHSICPIYKGNGEWGDDRETSNPASIVKMLMSHKMLGVNTIPDNQIDKFALGNIYNYCEHPYSNSNIKFECNGVLTSQERLFDVITKVLAICRSFVTRNGSKYSFFTDKRQTVPSCILNNHNILKDGLSNTKEFNQRVDGVRVSFINKAIGYQKDTRIAYRNGVDETSTDLNLADIELDYCTDGILAWKFARYELAKLQLRPETWTRKVGSEGNIFGVGNLLTLQDDTLLIGMGNGGVVTSVIKNAQNQVTGFKIDTKLDITESAKRYGVTVQHSSETSDILISTFEIGFSEIGYTDTISFVSPISESNIAVGDLVSFGEFGKISTDVICISKTRDSDGNFNCVFLPYSDGIFDYDEDENLHIPDFNSNVTAPANDIYNTPSVQRDSLTKGDVNDLKNYVNEEIDNVVIKATPIYVAEFNTTVIKKGNDGSYSPRTLIGEGFKKTGVTSQESYIGKWHFFIDDEEIEDESVIGASFTKDIKTLVDTYGDFGSIKVEFTATENQSILIDRMNIPILTGQAQYSVILSNPFQTYEVDESGNVSERTVTTKARVFYGLKELEYLSDDGWQYGVINYDSNVFDVSIDIQTGVISITSKAGKSMPSNGEIEIPIFIHSSTNTEIHIGYLEGLARAVEEVYIGYGQTEIGYLLPDENGFYYQYFTFQKLTETSLRLNSLNTKIDNYWKELTNDLVITTAERNTLIRLFDSISAEHTAYSVYQKYSKYADYNTAFNELSNAIKNIIDGTKEGFANEREKNEFNQRFETYYATKAKLDEEYSQETTYFYGISTLAKIPSSKKPNDYFLWSGEKNKIGNTDLEKGLVYYWTGTEWLEDKKKEHIMSTMEEALDVVKKIKDGSIPAVSFAKRLLTLQVVAEEIFAQYVEVKDIMTQGKTTIDGGKITTGSITADKIKAGEITADKIDVDDLMSKELVLNEDGVFKSENFNGKISYTANFQSSIPLKSGEWFEIQGEYFVVISDGKCIKAWEEPKVILSIGYPQPEFLIEKYDDFIIFNGQTLEVPVGSSYYYSSKYGNYHWCVNIGKGIWKEYIYFGQKNGTFSISNISDVYTGKTTKGFYLDSKGMFVTNSDSVIGGTISAKGYENIFDVGDYPIFSLGYKNFEGTTGDRYAKSRKFYGTGKVKSTISWTGYYFDESHYQYVSSIALKINNNGIDRFVYNKTIPKPTQSQEDIIYTETITFDVNFGDEITLIFTNEKMPIQSGRPVEEYLYIPYVEFSISHRNEFLMLINDLKEEEI